MTVNEFMAERRRFVIKHQVSPTKVTLHPADVADLLLELKAWEIAINPTGPDRFAGVTVEYSKTQPVGRALFE